MPEPLPFFDWTGRIWEVCFFVEAFKK
jgi:hypothetical protein